MRRVIIGMLATMAIGLGIAACADRTPLAPSVAITPPSVTPTTALKTVVVCETGWVTSGQDLICNGGVTVCDDYTYSQGAFCTPPQSPFVDFDPCWPFGCTYGGGGSSGGGSSPACNDGRDAMIAEYVQFGVGFNPTCASFTQFAQNTYYNWPSFTNQNEHAWAIIRQPLLVSASVGYGLEKAVTALGYAPSINSAYRCPRRQIEVLQSTAVNSRHLYGDAVDWNVVSNAQPEWQTMINALAVAHADYREPASGPCAYNCAHGDWRAH